MSCQAVIATLQNYVYAHDQDPNFLPLYARNVDEYLQANRALILQFNAEELAALKEEVEEIEHQITMIGRFQVALSSQGKTLDEGFSLSAKSLFHLTSPAESESMERVEQVLNSGALVIPEEIQKPLTSIEVHIRAIDAQIEKLKKISRLHIPAASSSNWHCAII